MDIVIKPTLQHISLVKIAVELWVQTDLLTLKNELETKVLEKMQILPLPKLLKKELKYCIRPIGSQIFQWFEYLNKHYQIVSKNLKEVYWTPYGTIDKARSIKILITNQCLNLEQRYRLACCYCLVDEIEELWKELTAEEKLQQEKWCHSYDITDRMVPQYWTNSLIGKSVSWPRLGEEPKNASSNYYGCHRAILSYNPTAIQYFYEKLNDKEKNICFSGFKTWLYSYRDVDATEAVWFLIPRINENQLGEMLRCFSDVLLSNLLVWPYQRFFLETAKRTWKFLENHDFYFLLIKIIGKIVEYGGEYRDIFREFWSASPEKFKRYVIHSNCIPWTICDCFERRTGEICRKVLSRSTAIKEKELLLSICGKREGLSSYMYLADKTNWKFFNFFVEECQPSKDTVDNFKKIVDELRFNDK